MGKLLSIRDYLLLSAAFAGDLLEQTRSGWGIMPSAMKGRYGFVPINWKHTSYVSSVSKILSTRDIKKVVDNKGKVLLELTSGGKRNFKRRFPLFMQSKKWDGYFMIVTFDIPESNRVIRRNLRIKLEELGFGMLQKSVYISPYHFEEDMREFVSINDLDEFVFVLTARKLLMGDLKMFAEKVWKLDKINRGYNNIVSNIDEMLKKGNRSKNIISKYAIAWYLKALVKDPILPNEFLPDDWARVEALKEINKLH